MDFSITELIAIQIVYYLRQIVLLSKINKENMGDITDYSCFVFGKPAKATYSLNEDGTLTVDLDFSSITWHWATNEQEEHVDINLDGEKNYLDVYQLMRDHQKGFNYLLKRDLIDFKNLEKVLFEKYGIYFEISYDEKTYSKTLTNGSEDTYSTAVCILNEIDSKGTIVGNVKTLFDSERIY